MGDGAVSAKDPEVGEFFHAIVKGPITYDDVAAAYHAAARLRAAAPPTVPTADRDADIIERVLDALMRLVPMEDALLPAGLRGVLDSEPTQG
jgi:hypothetical protein